MKRVRVFISDEVARRDGLTGMKNVTQDADSGMWVMEVLVEDDVYEELRKGGPMEVGRVDVHPQSWEERFYAGRLDEEEL